MAKREDLLAGFEKAYEDARKREAEDLHNAIGAVLSDHRASLQNSLFVLELIKFELLRAEYEKLMGNVKLSDKLPIATIGKKKDE